MGRVTSVAGWIAFVLPALDQRRSPFRPQAGKCFGDSVIALVQQLGAVRGPCDIEGFATTQGTHTVKVALGHAQRQGVEIIQLIGHLVILLLWLGVAIGWVWGGYSERSRSIQS